jgi:hypothetical protein
LIKHLTIKSVKAFLLNNLLVREAKLPITNQPWTASQRR